jgi:hypothetical protein
VNQASKAATLELASLHNPLSRRILKRLVTPRKHHFNIVFTRLSFSLPSLHRKVQLLQKPTDVAMAHQGQAADYYNGGGAPQQPEDAYYQGQPKYGQEPPQYGQNYQQSYAPPQGAPPMQQNGYQQDTYNQDSKTFEQQFKLEKPKYNDWWAGLLFIAVFLGYVAVSAITIRGYSNQHSGGIYGNTNQFALNSNTIILFAFVLGMATILSYAYMWAARAFTKQFIWITGILSKCARSAGMGWIDSHNFRSLQSLRVMCELLQPTLRHCIL